MSLLRRRRELSIAVGLSLAAHAVLFTGILWRRSVVSADTPPLLVELMPRIPLIEEPEPKEEPPPPSAQPPALRPPPLIAPPPIVPTTVAPVEAIPQARITAPPPVPAAPAGPTDELARTVIPGKVIDCRWPGLSAAERARCAPGSFAGRGPQRFTIPSQPPPGMPRYAMDRQKEVAFDALVDAKKPEPAQITATSRCDGWGSDNAQRNLGSGCFATSKPEGDGATRPKSKYVQPRGTPFVPSRRE